MAVPYSCFRSILFAFGPLWLTALLWGCTQSQGAGIPDGLHDANLDLGLSRPRMTIRLAPLGSYAAGPLPYAQGAEIVAHDPGSQRLFIVNVHDAALDVVDIHDPAKPLRITAIDLKPFGAHANSVAVHGGIVAVAIEGHAKTDAGTVAFFKSDGTLQSSVHVGALPDMLTFTRNGRKVLVACEGEPSDDYTVDPPGGVSVIDVSRGVDKLTQADVIDADLSRVLAMLDTRVRIFGPRATPRMDLEPEYIAVAADSKTAWVTFQENNAMGILDVEAGIFTALVPLGYKDHNLPGQGLDASDRDGGIHIKNWPLRGLYLPDAIASFEAQGQTYLVTANEGDSRDYAGFSEEVRVSSLTLDATAFPDAAMLKKDAALGRMRVTKTLGDIDKDGDYDELYSFGSRSFAIWDAAGTLVFDSGDGFERVIAEAMPANFNADELSNDPDRRSPSKGPEPETVTVGRAYGRTYAFIGVERIGGILVYELSDPRHPEFVQYINNRDFTQDPSSGAARDLSPEGVIFIAGEESPSKRPLLVVANEVSGTTTVYEIAPIFDPRGY